MTTQPKDKSRAPSPASTSSEPATARNVEPASRKVDASADDATPDTAPPAATAAAAAASSGPRHVWHVEAALEDLGSDTLGAELLAAFEKESGTVAELPDEVRPHVERALHYARELAAAFVDAHGRSAGTVTFDGLSSGVVQLQCHDVDGKHGTATLCVPAAYGTSSGVVQTR